MGTMGGLLGGKFGDTGYFFRELDLDYSYAHIVTNFVGSLLGKTPKKQG